MPELQGVFIPRARSIRIVDYERWEKVSSRCILCAKEDMLAAASARCAAVRVIDKRLGHVLATLPIRQETSLFGDQQKRRGDRIRAAARERGSCKALEPPCFRRKRTM